MQWKHGRRHALKLCLTTVILAAAPSASALTSSKPMFCEPVNGNCMRMEPDDHLIEFAPQGSDNQTLGTSVLPGHQPGIDLPHLVHLMDSGDCLGVVNIGGVPYASGVTCVTTDPSQQTGVAWTTVYNILYGCLYPSSLILPDGRNAWAYSYDQCSTVSGAPPIYPAGFPSVMVTGYPSNTIPASNLVWEGDATNQSPYLQEPGPLTNGYPNPIGPGQSILVFPVPGTPRVAISTAAVCSYASCIFAISEDVGALNMNLYTGSTGQQWNLFRSPTTEDGYATNQGDNGACATSRGDLAPVTLAACGSSPPVNYLMVGNTQ